MSDPVVASPTPGTAERSRRGQSLVEFALVLPLLIVLLCGAIDFGRAFFGWVALQNAARVGANYAATHPNAWATNNLAQQAEYDDLIRDSGARNCALTVNPPAFPDGTRDLGNRTRVDLACNFDLITPLMGALVGQPLKIGADATFPIRSGCADCGSAPAAPPPPPPANCRTIPDIVGTSVAGARAAWVAAGFTGPFTPVTGNDTRTVATRTVDQHGEVGCNGTTNAFFSSSISVTLATIVEPVPPDTCLTVPNLTGMTVAAARQAWDDAGFDTADFTPTTGSDTQIVQSQTHDPAALPGECVEPPLLVDIAHGAPPPPPPPPPCHVPSFINTQRSAAQATWNTAGFTTTVNYQPPAANWTLIKGQSLVGGNWAGCGSVITVSKND